MPRYGTHAALRWQVISMAPRLSGMKIVCLLSSHREKSMSTSKQIVLLDTLGEELFSGNSLLTSRPPQDDMDDMDIEEEAVPPTLRSSVSIHAIDVSSRHRSEIIEVTEVSPRDGGVGDEGNRAA
jgi:hypothetical protein